MSSRVAQKHRFRVQDLVKNISLEPGVSLYENDTHDGMDSMACELLKSCVAQKSRKQGDNIIYC